MSSRSNQLKDGILNQIAEQIKGLQIGQHKAFSEGTTNIQVTIKNIHLQCLLDLLDHILLHGLQHVECGYWPFVKELTHSDTVERISSHCQVSNDLDKGRVWIFTAFSDGLLESYIRLFVDSQKLAKKFYTKNAFVRDKERLVLLQTLASGLDFITLVLNQEDPYLGYGMPRFQESVVQEASLPSPITARRNASIYSLSLGDEDVDQSTASSFSNSSTVTDPLSPKSSSTDGSQDTILDDVDVALEMEILHSSKNGVDFSHKLQIGEYCKECKSEERRCSACKIIKVSDVSNLSEVQSNRSFQLNQSLDDDNIVFEPARKGSKKVCRKKGSSSENAEDNSIDMSYTGIPMQRQNEVEVRIDKNREEPWLPEEVCEEATDIPKSYEMSFTSENSYPAGSNDSLHGSVLSTDSLDQFCKGSDSSLNFTGDVSIDSPTLHICNNEGPLNSCNDSESKEAGDAIQNLSRIEGNSGQCALNVLESSEYDGIILGVPKRPSLKEIPVTSCDISVDQNMILTLSLGVFRKNDEHFNRIVVFMSGHISGQLCPILVLLTDHAVYLLRKVPSKEGTNFLVEWAFPFVTLKKVEVGLNYQTLTIASKSQEYSLFVADEAVTRDFLSSMTSMIVKAGHGSLSSIVSTSGIQQGTRIKRWLCELDSAQGTYQPSLSQSSSTNINCFSLVHWYGLSGPDANIEVLSYKSVKEGFLDCKQQHYLGMGSRWITSYFVLMNGTLYQHVKQGGKASRVVAQLRGSKSGGCRRIDDADRQFAFEIVSEDGSPLVVLAAPTEADASDWIFKLCQSVAEMFESQEEMGCTVMSCVPCCLTVTNDKIVTFLSDSRNEDTFQLLSSCCIQNVTRFFVDNDVRNYCILKFEHGDITSSEASWFIWLKTEYELSKFEVAVAHAWRELFKIDLQFLVLGEGPTRELARARAQSVEELYRYK